MTCYYRAREQRNQARAQVADLTDRIGRALDAAQGLWCDCYQPDLGEWAPVPCAKCLIVAELSVGERVTA